MEKDVPMIRTSKRAVALLLAGGALVLLPLDANAQKIPWIVLPLAVTPVVALLLSVALGVAKKSWLVGIVNTALVIVWVAWFAAASNYSTSDPLIWGSIVALGLHSLAMACLIALHAARRASVESRRNDE